jgi:hypothetical protein
MQATPKFNRSGGFSAKHLDVLRRYSSARKLVNIARCEGEKRLGMVRPGAMPYTATVDVTNVCNLKCPHCPTGIGLPGRKASMLKLDRIEKLLDEVGDYLMMAHLYNWGETLLHPQAPAIVKMFHDRRIYTTISSNLSLKKGEVLDAVCAAGLDRLILSIDGASQDTYEQYRVKGDLDLVFSNLRRIVDWRKANNSKTPFIQWQYIVFRHNEHQVEQAMQMAKDLGVDEFRIKRPTAPEASQPLDAEKRGTFYGERTFCGQLWHNIVLQADGGLSPCCNLYDAADDFGHLDTDSVRAVRVGDRYARARQLFGRSAVAAVKADPGHPCLRCPLVQKNRRLQGVLKDLPGAMRDDETMAVVGPKQGANAGS